MPATAAMHEMPVLLISGDCDFESGSGLIPVHSNLNGSGLIRDSSGCVVHIESCRSHPLWRQIGKIHMTVNVDMPGVMIRNSFEIDANHSKAIG